MNRIGLSTLLLVGVGLFGCGAKPADRGQQGGDDADQRPQVASSDPTETLPPVGETPPDYVGDDQPAVRLNPPRYSETPPDQASPDGTPPNLAQPEVTHPDEWPTELPLTLAPPRSVINSERPVRLPALEPLPAIEPPDTGEPVIRQPVFQSQATVPKMSKPLSGRVPSLGATPRLATQGTAGSTPDLEPPEAIAPSDIVAPYEEPAASMAMSPGEEPAASEDLNPVGDPSADISGQASALRALARATGADASVGTSQPQPDYEMVEVFYGTDRREISAETLATGDAVATAYNPAAGVGVVGALLLAAGLLITRRRTVLAIGGLGCLAVAGILAAGTFSRGQRQQHELATRGAAYSNERGTLQLGACRVSIPRTHQVGRLEAPSLLRLEVREDVRKHVVLGEIERYDEDTFYDRLRQRVAQSPEQDLFVFVHGYNVTFEDAARRTAQMAHDLKFPGAAVFFSWPSQGGLLKYTVDETNVAWTVPHLKKFLIDVSRRSGAQAVNLVAHSMGNRALTQALLELRYELQSETALFNQVVLAAPDIDAEIFRRDIAPLIQTTARRVTLYASSDDQALMASRNVHGYARAGESGGGLVVIPGIETIDVSGIDTSLLGHEYYGNSHSILEDLYDVIRHGYSASQRTRLLPMVRNGLWYWRLKIDGSTNVAQPPEDATLR